MVNRKTLKIVGAGLVVSAIAIGLGIGLGSKGVKNKETSASQAQGFDQCRRLIDGRYASPTNDVFEGKTRNLQWANDGYSGYTGGNAAAGGGSKSGGGSKGGSGSSKGSFSSNKGGSKGHSLHGSSKSGVSKGNSKSHSLHGISKSAGKKGSFNHSKGHYHAGPVKKAKGSYAYCSKGSSKGSYYDPCGEYHY
jgi:hypothetical protein